MFSAELCRSRSLEPSQDSPMRCRLVGHYKILTSSLKITRTRLLDSKTVKNDHVVGVSPPLLMRPAS